MSIYIPGMKMPKNCIDCAFGWNGWCHRINSRAFVEVDMRRHDCPLIEIPPHGRLIDGDTAYERFLDLMDQQGAINPCQLGTILVDAPTVIEAEEVYNKYTDTAGKLHWTGTHSGEHIIPADGGE